MTRPSRTDRLHIGDAFGTVPDGYHRVTRGEPTFPKRFPAVARAFPNGTFLSFAQWEALLSGCYRSIATGEGIVQDKAFASMFGNMGEPIVVSLFAPAG